jgi:hypothetical protein
MELLYFLLGLLVTIFFVIFTSQWDEVRERFPRWLQQVLNVLVRHKGEQTITIGTVTLKGVAEGRLKPTAIGNIILPIKVFVGGNGHTRYRYPDDIICEWNANKLVLPRDIQKSFEGLLEKRRQEAESRGAVFVQRDHVRIDDYQMGLQGIEDAPLPLRLTVSITDYYTVQATNASIDERLRGGSTIREKYAQDPSELRRSVLGNPLAVNMSVVTRDKQVFVAMRGKKTATNPGGFAPAVSGTGNNHTDCEGKGTYSPFLTAQREAEEEIISFKPRLAEITFFGLARTLKFQYPFLFGEIRLAELTSAELQSRFPRDNWESEGFIAMPLEIDSVVQFIRDVYRELEEKHIVNSGTYAAVFSVLQSLQYEYPDEWTRVVQMVSNLEKR